MIAFLLATSVPLASADTVRVHVEISGGELRIIDAVVSDSTLPQRTEASPSEDQTIRVVSADGRVLAAARPTDPLLRSVLHLDSSGEVAHLTEGSMRIELDWPEGATHVESRTNHLVPRYPTRRLTGTELVEVSSSGDASERLNMVFLGDGYMESELALFASDVERIADYMFSTIEPYGSYESAFNIWRIDRASNESGSSHYESSPQVLRDTAYGCFYGCAGIDRLICCDDGDVISAVDELLPEADGIMVLVNDPTYGGSGGFTYATSFTEGTSGEMVASHELGHSLIGLWDEYDYGLSGGGVGGPNCSDESDGEDWQHWLEEEGIDAFATCSYRDLYRPTENDCMMNSLQGNYCPICREETVRTLYDHLPSLWSSTSEPEGPISIGTDGLVLSVEATLPLIDTLDWTWTLDGNLVGTEPELRLEGCGPSGELVLILSDETAYVRDDPFDLLSDQLDWLIDRPDCEVADTASEVDSGTARSDGRCGCSYSGAAAWLIFLIPWVGQRRHRRRDPDIPR